MVNVTMIGAAGRMGRVNIAVFSEDRDIRIVGAVEDINSKYIGMDAGILAGINNIGVGITSNLEQVVEESDVAVDFTNCKTALLTIEVAEKYNKAVVVGTTGFSPKQIETIKNHSKKIPIILSPNMSRGVNTLFYLVKKAAELLVDEYDVEIFEIHHNLKKDAPSGTALKFGKIIANAKGKNLDEIGVFGRHGLIGKREKDEIGIMALRVADVVSEHTIIFGSPGERIEFTHRTTSRKTYASGALRAVKFIANQKNGFFSIEDVFGIKDL